MRGLIAFTTVLMLVGVALPHRASAQGITIEQRRIVKLEKEGSRILAQLQRFRTRGCVPSNYIQRIDFPMTVLYDSPATRWLQDSHGVSEVPGIRQVADAIKPEFERVKSLPRCPPEDNVGVAGTYAPQERTCSLYGAGFYYLPGTDTCLNLSATVVRARLRVPQVQAGTLVEPGVGEFPGAKSAHWLNGAGATATAEFKSPLGAWRFSGSYSNFDGDARSRLDVGRLSAFTYFNPNPLSGSTGVGPTTTGQDVSIATSGSMVDLMLEHRSVVAKPAPYISINLGIGVRYRHTKIEHDIMQQSLTFPDLKSTAGIDIKSNFVAPSISLGISQMPAGPSGFISGVDAFVAPGALITNASASQTSECGPCGALSPERNVSEAFEFDKTSFALMSGVSGYLGYQVTPRFSIRAEAGWTAMSRADTVAIPITPTQQPPNIDSDSMQSVFAGVRATGRF